jgi:hypothetical protein
MSTIPVGTGISLIFMSFLVWFIVAQS